MVKMNNEMHSVTKDEVGEQIWELLKIDSQRHRTENYEKTHKGESMGIFVRLGKRYLVRQKSADKNDIEVFQYETLYH